VSLQSGQSHNGLLFLAALYQYLDRPNEPGGARHHSLAELERADTFLMGRVTYEKFVARWPGINGDPYFDHINRMPKLDASTTLREPGWNTRVIEGDVPTTVAELKRQPGKNIIKYGSGRLTRTPVACSRVLTQRG
jgi:dihydrofolate reductase